MWAPSGAPFFAYQNTMTTNELLNSHTALASLTARQSLLLSSPETFNRSRLAMATAAALAAGHMSPSPLGAGWTVPVLFISFHLSTTELKDEAEQLASFFGKPADGSLVLIGTDKLQTEGFPLPNGSNIVSAMQSALQGLLRVHRVKTLVLDKPDDYPATVALSLAARQLSVPTLATAAHALDRPGSNAFQAEVRLVADDEAAVYLEFQRPYSGFARPLALPGLAKD